MYKVGIVIVNYNGYKDTIDCILSLQRIDYPDYEIVVVDNGSTDKSLAELKRLHIENLVVLDAKENLGFSGGNNLGIHYAMNHGSDFILLLNNDTLVEKDFLSKLMIGGEGGVATSKILYADNPHIIWYAGGKINSLTGRTSHIGINENDVGKYNTEKEVSFISGCCMLIPKFIIDSVGYMNEEYFLYCEDVDYCCRLKKYGYRLIYCPSSVIYHKVHASAGKSSELITYYMVRNKRYIIDKYFYGISYLVAHMFNWMEERKRIMTREYSVKAVNEAKKDYKKGHNGKKMF